MPAQNAMTAVLKEPVQILRSLDRLGPEGRPFSAVCYLDTETTGVDPSSDRIVQVAAVRCGTEMPPVGDASMNEYVNPGLEAVGAGMVPRVNDPPWRLEPAAGPRLEELRALLARGDASSAVLRRLVSMKVLSSARSTSPLPDISMGSAVDAVAVLSGREPDEPKMVSPFDVHGIPPDVLLSAEPWSVVAVDLIPLLSGACLVAHNVDFDYGFLTSEMARAEIVDWQPSAVVCSRDLAGLAGVPPDRSRLRDLAAGFGSPNPKEHDAMSDVEALMVSVGGLMEVLVGARDIPPEMVS